MKLEKMVLGFNSVNCYLLIDEESKETAIVDPGSDVTKIVSRVNAEELNVKYILLTHAHGDHIGAALAVKKNTNAPIFVHIEDTEMLGNPQLNYTANMPIAPVSIEPDAEYRDGDTFLIGRTKIKALHTPGHSRGSCCLHVPSQHILLSGDTLFYGSVGRTDLYGGSQKELIRSIQEKLMVLSDETKVYPGHGASTSIGFERRKNIFIQG